MAKRFWCIGRRTTREGSCSMRTISTGLQKWWGTWELNHFQTIFVHVLGTGSTFEMLFNIKIVVTFRYPTRSVCVSLEDFSYKIVQHFRSTNWSLTSSTTPSTQRRARQRAPASSSSTTWRMTAARQPIWNRTPLPRWRPARKRP